MAEIQYKNLKISSLTKNRLDKLKGRTTYDKFFDQVIEYFELTGIDPKHDRLPPAVSINNTIKTATDYLYKRVDDAIKIIRNIELSKLEPMSRGVEALLKGGITQDPENIVGPKEEELFQMIEMVENQRNEIKTKNTVIDNLQRELQTAKNTTFSVTQNSDIKDVIQTVEELLSEKTLQLDKNGNFIITREYRKQLIEKIKTYSHV